MPQPSSKRVVIVEGSEGAEPIQRGYVVQGDKLWVAFDDLASARPISESVEGRTIVESIDKLELVERKDGTTYVKDGIWYVECLSQRSNVKNANGRVYSRKLWERLIGDSKSRVQETIRNRGMIGHLEHPKDGRTDGNLGALLVVSSKLDEDGAVFNRYELLDTPAGKILQEYTRKKVRWGVSSRGTGTIDASGKVNEDDYMVETWDAVMRPSTLGAFVEPLSDSSQASAKVSESVQDATKEVKAWLSEATSVIGKDSETAGKTAELLSLLGKAPVAHDKGNNDFATVYAALVNRVQESLANASGSDAEVEKYRCAFVRVVEGLQAKAKASIEEATASASKLVTAQDALTKAKADADAKDKRIAALESELAKANKKLVAATEAIAASTARQVSESQGDVQEVDDLIARSPRLARFRAVLEAATEGTLTDVGMALLRETLTEDEQQPARPSVAPAGLPVGVTVEDTAALRASVTSQPSKLARSDMSESVVLTASTVAAVRGGKQ